MNKPTLGHLTNLCIIFLAFSCSSTEDGNGATGPGGLVPLIDCASFFDTGDYSDMCFAESARPEVLSTDTAGSLCFTAVGTVPNVPQEREQLNVTISVADSTVGNSIAVAITIHAELKASHQQEIEEGSSDKTLSIEEIGGLGDEAFYFHEDTEVDPDNHSLYRVLHVRHKNAHLSITSQSRSGSAADALVCAYSTTEMEKFARLVIANL